MRNGQSSGPALRYDEAQLVKELSRLTPVKRAIFAAACAERMMPIYRWFNQRTGRGDPAALEGALAALWVDLEGGDSSGLVEHQHAAEELVPYEDDSWVDSGDPDSAPLAALEVGFAQHAAAAVSYAIRCRLTSDAQEAGWAARQVYHALDLWITTRDDVDLNATKTEEGILADPLIQVELRRQQRELKQLGEVADDGLIARVSQIREKARQDADTLFGTAI